MYVFQDTGIHVSNDVLHACHPSCPCRVYTLELDPILTNLSYNYLVGIHLH